MAPWRASLGTMVAAGQGWTADNFPIPIMCRNDDPVKIAAVGLIAGMGLV